MTIDALYPYWDDVHNELIGKIEILTEEQLEAKPHDRAKSIGQLVLDYVYDERYYVAHIGGGYNYERPHAATYTTAESLIDLLNAQREVTARVLEPLTVAGLRSVRMVPAEPSENQPDTNMPVGWLFWHVMKRQMECLGQVKLRLADESSKTPGHWG